MARSSRLLREVSEDQINISVPGPLNARLDALVELANAAGENTTRKEIVAALLLSAPESGEALADQVRALRRAKDVDATVEGFDVSSFVEPQKQSPGPRPRRRT